MIFHTRSHTLYTYPHTRQEAEEAVEKERAAAATRLREACERYEQQLAMQRMRLVSDGDLRLEQLEAAR